LLKSLPARLKELPRVLLHKCKEGLDSPIQT
jgi:hypothetical protein